MAEKKGFIYRMTMGRDDNPDYTTDKLPGSRWAVFWDIFKTRFWTLVKLNLLMLIFCLPAIAWMVLMNVLGLLRDQALPYTAHLGFGYSGETQVYLIGAAANLQTTLMSFSILIPLLMLASLGFAGGFHTMKMLAWGEGISVAQTFFKGIKSNLLPFLFGTLILGAGIFIVAMNFSMIGMNDMGGAISVLTTVSSIILLVLLAMMAMYMYTQAVTYKLKFWGLLRNSFIFAIGILIQNILFLALTAVPFVMLFILPPTFGLIFGFYLILVGLSVTILIWTLFAHYVFDKFLNDKIEGAIKDRGVYRKSKEEIERKRAAAIETRRKKANSRYLNPKKKHPTKSIDEGATFQPLQTTFSRKDIQRLQEEKEKVKAEIEEDYEEIGPDETAEDTEAAADALLNAPRDAGFDDGASSETPFEDGSSHTDAAGAETGDSVETGAEKAAAVEPVKEKTTGNGVYSGSAQQKTGSVKPGSANKPGAGKKPVVRIKK